MNQDPRIAHLYRNIDIRKVLVRVGFLTESDIIERNLPCPFHSFGREARPSARCYTDSEKCEAGLFHCFTCNSTWDPIKFVMDFKEIPFWDSLLWLERSFDVVPPPIDRAIQQSLQESKEDPQDKDWGDPVKKLDTLDMLLSRSRNSLPLKDFRLYSDLSDLLRYQVDQGDTESPRRVSLFLFKIKKVLGL